ncbi:hypothetical protein LAUMK7_00718 [Mycobacterium kansasii]|nr:hypothetical protein I547_2135 [Mycobacterium kansasii 824]OOK68928.1 hypothetical protein BZL30_6952 [Mycobacterium kansasii]VAZ58307.1 hypothetical protein LAUMK22_00092 [Mycobacterium kansasii]VAZ64700.1 hypothetical protein LAUMK40_00818 [Mycobacterium kansasii]VAZ71296.1 hypothetical protein LAUMK7_00718 [Mycobacterium kansasii]
MRANEIRCSKQISEITRFDAGLMNRNSEGRNNFDNPS